MQIAAQICTKNKSYTFCIEFFPAFGNLKGQKPKSIQLIHRVVNI